MSRGLGRFQCDLVALVRAKPATSTLENLRWAAHEQSKSGDLPKSYAFAVERAVRSLASPRRAILSVEKRRLASLEEWVAHYPGKTLDSEVRQLRSDLLPVLAEWLVRRDGPGPRFSALENERFAFSGSKLGAFGARVKAQVRHVQFGDEWKGIEQYLWPHAQRAGNDELFYLLVRGRELFTAAPVESKVPFRDLVESCIGRRLLPNPVLERLRSFADRVLPRTEAESLVLKSYVYRCIQPVRIRQPEMRPEALQALMAAKPDYMKALPGFNPPGPVKGAPIFPEAYRWRDAVAKGSALARLIDQSVFREFHFLRLNQ